MKDAWRSIACVSVTTVLILLAAGCSPRQSDWEIARKADTAQAYTDFLKRYPDGDFVSQARARLSDLEAEGDWNAAVAADTAEAYQQFIEHHAVGPHAEEARIRIENLNLAHAPAEAPVVAAVPAAGFRVQLGAFSSAARARSEWQQAVKAHPAELTGLGYTIEDAVVGNVTLHRLQSGPVPEEKARAICDALKSEAQPCVVVLPGADIPAGN